MIKNQFITWISSQFCRSEIDKYLNFKLLFNRVAFLILHKKLHFLRRGLIEVLLITSISGCAQIPKEECDKWKKSVVNIETEGYLFPQFYMDSVYKSKSDSGYSKARLDSLSKVLHSTVIGTGTAIYIKYRGRKYLVTAKHVIVDESLVAEEAYENQRNGKDWQLQAIRPRISIRTPFEYWMKTKALNNFAVFNFSFIKGARSYFFISDSTR